MVGKCVVIELMVTAREIFVEENLQAIIVPILKQWVPVCVDQDVVSKFGEKVQLLLGPDNLEFAIEILGRILRSEPALIEWLPCSLLPDCLVGHSVDGQGRSRFGRTIFAAIGEVRIASRRRIDGHQRQEDEQAKQTNG